MDKRTTRILTFALIAGASLLAACSASPAALPTPSNSASGPTWAPSNGLVQSSSAGNVTVDIKWLGSQNGSLAFQVDMNTHSVDLDQYDLDKLALLRDDAGGEYTPTSWLSAPGGHHREGTITFSIPQALTEGKARSIRMVIRGVAGVAERVLEWRLS